MTGPEHYEEAERLMRLNRGQNERALVHATLALAAAVATPSYINGMATTAGQEWREAVKTE